MLRPTYLIRAGAMAMALGLGAPDDAHAYIDPGTGSYVLQLILAGLFGAFYAIKTYWGGIKAFFGLSKATEKEGSAQDSGPE